MTVDRERLIEMILVYRLLLEQITVRTRWIFTFESENPSWHRRMLINPTRWFLANHAIHYSLAIFKDITLARWANSIQFNKKREGERKTSSACTNPLCSSLFVESTTAFLFLAQWSTPILDRERHTYTNTNRCDARRHFHLLSLFFVLFAIIVLFLQLCLCVSCDC